MNTCVHLTLRCDEQTYSARYQLLGFFFVDCAIVANAQYIVTEDRHFKVLETIDFPKVDVVGLDEFLAWLIQV